MGLSKEILRLKTEQKLTKEAIIKLEKVLYRIDQAQQHVLVTLSVLQKKGVFTDDEIQEEFDNLKKEAAKSNLIEKATDAVVNEPKDRSNMEDSSRD